ncbi:MAG: hypothetical protein PUC82_03945 [bacterium]|nr:hypothetical protein [bacterium]
MKEKFRKIRPYIKYFLIFFFFLFWNLIVQPVNLDEIWNYGFVNNIYRGLVPYRDFNMVITPFFPMLMAIPFYIFGSNMLIFNIEQAFILTVIFYIIYDYLKEKSYLFILVMICPLSISFPSYNMFLLLLFFLLIKLEDSNANDYLMGVLLACFILTKQTVGVMMALVTLYYFDKPKKIFKRLIGMIIPGIFFIIYLVITGSIRQFFDLCLFGLFDFATTNGRGINIYFLLGLVMIGIIIYLIRKDKKNIKNYYFLAFFSILIPLFDLYHFKIVVLAFLFVFLIQRNVKIYLNIEMFTFFVCCFLIVINLWYRVDGKVVYPNNINHFEHRYLTNKYISYSNRINELFHKYSDREVVFLSADGYYFKIINDLDVSYLDLINMGNWGYNGSKKLLDEIKSKDNFVAFVDKNEFSANTQTEKKALEYVINNGKFLEKEGSYYIYEVVK